MTEEVGSAHITEGNTAPGFGSDISSMLVVGVSRTLGKVETQVQPGKVATVGHSSSDACLVRKREEDERNPIVGRFLYGIERLRECEVP